MLAMSMVGRAFPVLWRRSLLNRSQGKYSFPHPRILSRADEARHGERARAHSCWHTIYEVLLISNVVCSSRLCAVVRKEIIYRAAFRVSLARHWVLCFRHLSRFAAIWVDTKQNPIGREVVKMISSARHKMIARSLTRGFCVVVLATIVTAGAAGDAAQDEKEDEAVEFHGPDVHPGYPDSFHVSYTLRKSALSPDGKYGVIFPDRNLEDSPGADFVVAVKDSSIVGLVELNSDDVYFRGKNHGGLNVYWAPDSSAALVESEGKWEPRALVLIELKDGRIARQTELSGALSKLIDSAAPKADHFRAGVELDVNDVSWKAGKSLQLKCEVTSNPKGNSGENSWAGTVTAVWDVALHKFLPFKVKQTSFHKAGKGER